MDIVDYNPKTASTSAPVRNLERIEYLANRVETVVDKLGLFVGRFHGSPEASASPKPQPVPSGYQGQMERLDNLLGLLEIACMSITEIG